MTRGRRGTGGLGEASRHQAYRGYQVVGVMNWFYELVLYRSDKRFTGKVAEIRDRRKQAKGS